MADEAVEPRMDAEVPVQAVDQSANAHQDDASEGKDAQVREGAVFRDVSGGHGADYQQHHQHRGQDAVGHVRGALAPGADRLLHQEEGEDGQDHDDDLGRTLVLENDGHHANGQAPHEHDRAVIVGRRIELHEQETEHVQKEQGIPLSVHDRWVHSRSNHRQGQKRQGDQHEGEGSNTDHGEVAAPGLKTKDRRITADRRAVARRVRVTNERPHTRQDQRDEEHASDVAHGVAELGAEADGRLAAFLDAQRKRGDERTEQNWRLAEAVGGHFRARYQAGQPQDLEVEAHQFAGTQNRRQGLQPRDGDLVENA
mmetsp:Transcript_44350/g.142069  ORF Transcript_44350/g.142069 Transcript_44350/m.142069 type:complete len:312 (+) Transcript_44350:1298-2233(+)